MKIAILSRNTKLHSTMRLTEAARERHLALAQDYQKRAEQLRSGAA